MSKRITFLGCCGEEIVLPGRFGLCPVTVFIRLFLQLCQWQYPFLSGQGLEGAAAVENQNQVASSDDGKFSQGLFQTGQELHQRCDAVADALQGNAGIEELFGGLQGDQISKAVAAVPPGGAVRRNQQTGFTPVRQLSLCYAGNGDDLLAGKARAGHLHVTPMENKSGAKLMANKA